MPSQNLQDAFLNAARKERLPVTIYLTSGVKLSGRVRGFDKYCVIFETNHQEQLLFKHAISTVVTPRPGHDRGPEREGPAREREGDTRENGSGERSETPRRPGQPPMPAEPIEE